jgi:hypothetical protein
MRMEGDILCPIPRRHLEAIAEGRWRDATSLSLEALEGIWRLWKAIGDGGCHQLVSGGSGRHLEALIGSEDETISQSPSI